MCEHSTNATKVVITNKSTAWYHIFFHFFYLYLSIHLSAKIEPNLIWKTDEMETNSKWIVQNIETIKTETYMQHWFSQQKSNESMHFPKSTLTTTTKNESNYNDGLISMSCAHKLIIYVWLWKYISELQKWYSFFSVAVHHIFQLCTNVIFR